jgi:hypothetical protein
MRRVALGDQGTAVRIDHEPFDPAGGRRHAAIGGLREALGLEADEIGGRFQAEGRVGAEDACLGEGGIAVAVGSSRATSVSVRVIVSLPHGGQ